MLKYLLIAYLLVGAHIQGNCQESSVYTCDNGTVHFLSDAPLEMIEARSNQLKGVINATNREFVFSVMIRSFEGFNSPLQREHFNENYLESEQYAKAHFTGKIIERINISETGTYDIRTKGILNIHGVKQERIIRSQVSSGPNGIHIKASFTILLDDHEIRIPKVVNQKIAQEILVKVEGIFELEP
ncbi:MAG: YceI family protein [Bacteroidota bacterium]